jgi:hypothetical protein
MLAEGNDMIRVAARYSLVTEDFDVLDRFTDALMDSLMLVEDILDPDIGLSLTDRALEVTMVVDTMDPFEATERAARALRVAFGAAGVGRLPSTRVFVHEDLLGPQSALQTELLAV